MFFLIGILPPAVNLTFVLSDSTLYFSWEPPPVLPDVTDSEIDATYCVEVNNSITAETLLLKCGINITNYNYTIPSDNWCYITYVTIISVNLAGEKGGRITTVYVGTDMRKHTFAI